MSFRSSIVGVTAFVGVFVLCGAASAQEAQIAQLRADARRNPADAKAELALGRALVRAGRPGEAMPELRRGIGQVSGRGGEIVFDLHWELARAHNARHETGQAIVQCQVIRDKPGGTAWGRACAAEAWLVTLRASESHLEAKEALKVADIPPRVRYRLHVTEGIAYALELKYAEAESELGEALKIDADGVDAHLALGKLLAQEGKDGVPDLRKAVALDGDNPETLYELARVLRDANAQANAPEVVQILQRAIAARPTYGAAYRLTAVTELGQGHLPEAKRAAESALRIEPQDVAAHLVMGDVALADNRFDDALREGQIAGGLVSNSAAAKLLVADAYAKKNEIDLALENYQASYSFDHLVPTALVHAALACVAAGRPTSAKAFGEKATQEFPDWGPGWVALGDALVAYQDNAGARRAYEQAKRVKGPVDAAAIDRKLAALK
jgi:tetratricopeptide (TPR) repeat protein